LRGLDGWGRRKVSPVSKHCQRSDRRDILYWLPAPIEEPGGHSADREAAFSWWLAIRLNSVPRGCVVARSTLSLKNAALAEFDIITNAVQLIHLCLRILAAGFYRVLGAIEREAI
jgi:hypothetical protein